MNQVFPKIYFFAALCLGCSIKKKIILSHENRVVVSKCIEYPNISHTREKLTHYQVIKTDSLILNHIKNQTSYKFKHLKFQYFKMFNKKGMPIVLASVLNISKKKELKYIEKWRKQFIIGYGDFYEENTKIFYINLKTNHISKF